jgi:hypothetical protein
LVGGEFWVEGKLDGGAVRARWSTAVIAEQVRTLDLSQRWWRSTEECLPAAVVDQVVATLNLRVSADS